MNLSDFNTLTEAQEYSETTGKIINRDTMNNLLALSGVYIRFKEIAVDNTHQYQNMTAAFLDSQNYNFIIGNETGDAQITVLDAIIAANIDISPALTALKPIILSKANITTHPFADVTQSQFNTAKNELLLTGKEEVLLTNSIEQKVYTLSIAKTAPKAIAIKIMQRFGNNASDLTDGGDST